MMKTYLKVYNEFIWPIGSAVFEWTQYVGMRIMSRHTESKMGLEIASGPIPYYEILRKQGESLVITDLSASNLRRSRFLHSILRLGKQDRTEYVIADKDYLPFKDGVFDRSFSINLNEKTNNSEATRVTKGKDGYRNLFFFLKDVS
jgi:ubiquinone/menaquinone biosynthesis C-methylase UbiE